MADDPTLTYLELRIRARERIKSGVIPSVVPAGLSAGYGSSLNNCVLCGLSIDPTQVEYEVCLTGLPVNLHVACYAAWRDECLHQIGGHSPRARPLSGLEVRRYNEPLKHARSQIAPGARTGELRTLRVIDRK